MVCHLHGTVVPESTIIGTLGLSRFIFFFPIGHRERSRVRQREDTLQPLYLCDGLFNVHSAPISVYGPDFCRPIPLGAR